MNLLLAAVLLVQDKSAEEIFKSIEETVQKAKTIRVKCRTVSEANIPGYGREPATTTGELFLRDGNRAAYYGETAEVGGIRQSFLRSDGTRMLGWEGKKLQEVTPTNITVEVPKTLKSEMTSLLIRYSTGASGEIILGRVLPWRSKGRGPDADEEEAREFTPSGFEHAQGDGKTQSLTYKLTGMVKAHPHQFRDVKVQMWYDPAKLVPVRRIIACEFTEGGNCTNTETYEEFTLNADIPDEKFKLPDEKK
jgi:hypothetical protein